MSLFEELIGISAVVGAHESDLYVLDTPEVAEILKKYPEQRVLATRFTDQVTGKVCLDIPFAYEPWWEAREEKIA